jgi:large subunit ribosomal protein L21
VADVLLVTSGDKTTVGTPVVAKASVKLEVLVHEKGEKIRVATFKAKSRYRKVKGHRQALTQVKVVSITA